MSGRNASVREALFATLREAALHPTLHCVLVCRDYDLEGDDQFRALLGRNPTTNENRNAERVQIKPLDWEGEIIPLLAARGIGEDITQKSKMSAIVTTQSVSLSVNRKERFFARIHNPKLFRRSARPNTEKKSGHAADGRVADDGGLDE